jgi:Flp pilus assembly protein TadG
MRTSPQRSDHGQSIVEFAVIFPIFILLVFSVIDFGFAMQQRGTLQHAAREGARYAATRDNADGGAFVMGRTLDQAQALVEQNDVCITYVDLDGSGDIEEGDAVDVEISYVYEPFIFRTALGFFGGSAPNVDMTVTGSARLELDLDDQAGLCP